MKKRLNNRGVSLAEAVIAMAIILTVSATAAGLMSRFSHVSADMMHRNAALNVVDSTVECFKYSEDHFEFDRMIYTIPETKFERVAYNETRDDEDNLTAVKIKYRFVPYGYFVYIVLDYDYTTGVGVYNVYSSLGEYKEAYEYYDGVDSPFDLYTQKNEYRSKEICIITDYEKAVTLHE